MGKVHDELRTVFDEEAEKRGKITTFPGGAVRENAAEKIDLEGFLSPLVLDAYAQYMHFNRTNVDGSLRDSDNWQKGMPYKVYMKSLWRHFFDLWKEHRLYPSKEGIVWACCGVMFNVMGYLHEFILQDRNAVEKALRRAEERRSGDKKGMGFLTHD